jgi:hypothetical protein
MRRTTKCILVVGAVLLCVVVAEALREQYAPVTEHNARKAAQVSFEHLCRDFHLRSSDYQAPVPTSVGGADFAYEWKSRRPGVQSVLIYVARGGIVEPTWIDDVK